MVVDAFRALVATPGMLTLLGYGFAIAMLVGGVLGNGLRTWIKWGVAVAGMFVLEETARLMYLEHIGREPTIVPVILGGIILTIYGSGIGLGLWIVLWVGRSAERTASRLRDTDPFLKKLRELLGEEQTATADLLEQPTTRSKEN